ncbi:MAG: hypothetical protein ACP5JG_09880 [Anaerolineae bacterium]
MNRATRVNVATLGTIFGISGWWHGFFEALQGNTPADIGMIKAIGEGHRMWSHGSEPALTLIPNFLASGIVAMLLGLLLIVWSLFFVHRKHGATVFLLLFILLLLFGGGVAQIIFFPFIWLVSTRINKPLRWWREALPAKTQNRLGKLWPWSLIVTSAPLAFALYLAITGLIPGVRNEEAVLAVMMACLVIVLVTFPVTFISGFAHDIAHSQ